MRKMDFPGAGNNSVVGMTVSLVVAVGESEIGKLPFVCSGNQPGIMSFQGKPEECDSRLFYFHAELKTFPSCLYFFFRM